MRRNISSIDYDILEECALKIFLKKVEKKKQKSLDNKNKARIGFYYLVFDLLYNMNQVEEVNTCITDQTFSNIMRQQDNKDLGIDAVYIDEENKEVNFF